MINLKHSVFIVLLIFFFFKDVGAQKQTSKINDFYATKDSVGLDRFVSLWFHPNSDSLEFVSDTLYAVYQIHKSILIDNKFYRGGHVQNDFFFVQEKYPQVSINYKKIEMPNILFYNYFLSCDTVRALSANSFWFDQIAAFLGQNPSNSQKSYINSYLKDKRQNRNIIHKKAVREINDYRDKSDFLHKIFDLCYTWGHVSKDYTRLTVHSINFLNTLTVAEVEWGTCAYGGKYIYEYKRDTWVITKTLGSWIH